MQTSKLAATIAAALAFSAPAIAQEAPCGGLGSRAEAEIAAHAKTPKADFDKVIGRTAAACSYNDAAARMFEREQARRSTPIARFNLATAYARLGRIEDARELYRSAAADGAFQWVVADPMYGAAASRPRRFNVADEALRRLAQIDAYVGASPRAGAASVADVATDASISALALNGSR